MGTVGMSTTAIAERGREREGWQHLEDWTAQQVAGRVDGLMAAQGFHDLSGGGSDLGGCRRRIHAGADDRLGRVERNVWSPTVARTRSERDMDCAIVGPW
ncbi:hypothetical protein KP509_07G001600 [Ceratopteris richardii]|uniref:Uncharacterized protein n=1 Tax=Ceratopteris richardii TaxID=49495 RepID=A0A8T2UHT4_CERRI|nr:hypothetical protein KP509_07G001600 [Ceratopteris richardii]